MEGWGQQDRPEVVDGVGKGEEGRRLEAEPLWCFAGKLASGAWDQGFLPPASDVANLEVRAIP